MMPLSAAAGEMKKCLDNRLFVCCLNVQEGRNPPYLSQLSSLCSRHLVKTFTDPILNRTNLTLVGEGGELEGVVGRLAHYVAGNHGDRLVGRVREGGGETTFKEHHHIGAIDLVPVHPLSDGATLAEAGQIARRISHTFNSLSIPTLLYGAADTEGRSLVEVRRARGFFSSQDHSCGDRGVGVSVVGATPYVLSFNMALNTPDLAIAKSFLPWVRGRAVQAMAYRNTHPAHGTVSEISCNLTDPGSADGCPETVLARVSELASKQGLSVCHSYSTNPPFDQLIELYRQNGLKAL